MKNKLSPLFRLVVGSRAGQTLLAVLWSMAVLEASIALFMFAPGANAMLPATIRQGLSQLYGDRVARHISMLPECAQYDPETFYTLKAAARCRHANVEYDTSVEINSAGLRDAEGDLKAPEIIALGDSYTQGVGVEADETFVAQIERLTGKRILNSGISSFGTEREFRMLRRLDTSNLKLVILQYSGNDAGENLSAVSPGGFNIRSADEYRRISAKHVRKTRYLPFKLSFYLIRDVLIRGHLGNIGRADKRASRHRREVAAFLAIFEKIRGLAPSARFIVTEFNGHGNARRSFLAALEKHFEGDGSVSVVPVEPDLPDEAFFTLDRHINGLGHRLTAERIAPHVERGLTGDRRQRNASDAK